MILGLLGRLWQFLFGAEAPEPESEDLYPRFVAQPATDPWNWLQCGMGFGATFEGVPCLNVPEGTESTPFSKDVQLGIKQTQFLQWNPLWLAAQAEPPTYDPTYVRNLNVRMVQLLVRQEQLTGTTLGAAVGPATTDDAGNSLGFLYPWDLQRADSDDNSLYGGIHVRALGTGGAPFAPIVCTGAWITHGRAHGMAYQNGEFVRNNEGVSSDDPTLGRAKFYRRPVDSGGIPTGPWEACGSMSPGVTARWVSPPAKEGGYLYGTKATSSSVTPDSTGKFITREYQDLICFFPFGEGVYVVEWKRNIIFVFEHNDNKIEHIYTSPPRHYYAGGKNQASYDLPRLDVTGTSGSPAGYVDKHGFLYLYHVHDNTVKKLVSKDMGQNWQESVAVISGENISKAIELWKDGISFCLAINTEGQLWCYRSSTHFADGTWTLNTNKFLIIGSVEDVQPGGYFAGDKMYAFAGVGTTRKGYESPDMGRNWSEIV